MITKEDFDYWLENSVTKEFFSIITDYKEASLIELLDGFPNCQMENLLAVGERIGRVNAFRDALSISFNSVDENKGEE